jgi:hypothetical protein
MSGQQHWYSLPIKFPHEDERKVTFHVIISTKLLNLTKSNLQEKTTVNSFSFSFVDPSALVYDGT